MYILEWSPNHIKWKKKGKDSVCIVLPFACKKGEKCNYWLIYAYSISGNVLHDGIQINA